tara:strand:+ start:251 stop:838 length:588 start_codon:yes stop_codon:yes gene_type:complete
MQGLLNQAGGEEQAPVQEAMPAEDTGGDEFQDPALQRAIAYVGDRLYGPDKVSEEIARQLGQADTPMPKMIAGLAYTLAEAADTATDGLIKEENLSILGMLTLNEVFTIAQTAGMPLADGDISAAMKQMIIMYGQENGLTPEELDVLSQGMTQIDDAQFATEAAALPDEFGDSLPDYEIEDEEEPMQQPAGAMGA